MTNAAIVDLVVQSIIDLEGGYVHHPDDRGGPTKYGVTIDTLSAFRGYGVTPEQVADLTREEAADIYAMRYVYGPGLDAISDPALFEAVVDGAVHSGPKRSIKWLQEALRITADGIIGPVTRDNLIHCRSRLVRARYLAARLRFLGALITEDRSQAAFAKGWLSRIAGYVEGTGYES